MQSKEDFFNSFSYEKEIERAKWFKDDLDKGGWEEIHRSPGNVYWVKIFPDEDVPVKVLFNFEIAMPAKMFPEMLHPRNQDKRNQWDRTFLDHEILKTYPDDQGFITFMRTPTSWPLRDRTFVLFIAPSKEIDWFGQQAFLLVEKDAWHQSKPDGADGHVKATNGGNFFVVIPDETDPNAERCSVFGLTSNNFNGWVPKRCFSRIVTSKVPPAFDVFTKTLVEGYIKYFKKN